MKKMDIQSVSAKHGDLIQETKTSQTGDDKDSEQENQKSEVLDTVNKCVRCYIPRRYLASCLTGIGMMLVYVMRTNIGVTAITFLDESSVLKVGTPKAQENLPLILWNERMVGFLHSIFYVGYLLSILPGGYLTTVCKCSRLYGGCILFSGVLNLVLPFSIEEMTFAAPCVIRFTQGLSEGLLYPACYGVLRHWSTPDERGRLVSAVLTGCYVGAIIGFPLSGLFTHYIGWQYVFYVSGASCIMWYLIWLCFVTEKPSHHSSISDEELEYLASGQGQTSVDYENLKIPWRSILTSLPVLALCFCHFARNWVFILMITNEPYFLNHFGFNLAQNGIYSSLPHILKVILAFLGGFVADYLLIKRHATTNFVRKLLTAIGFFGQALFFFLLTMNNARVLVLAFLTLGLGIFGLSVPGWQINHYDLAARYAGVLVSISSTHGTIAAITVPLVTGELTYRNPKSLTGWNYVFYITVAILLFAGISFLVFGSGEDQSWAHPPPNIQLIQKVDPLERKPYTIKIQQKSQKSTEPVERSDSRVSTENLQNRLIQRLSQKTQPQR